LLISISFEKKFNVEIGTKMFGKLSQVFLFFSFGLVYISAEIDFITPELPLLVSNCRFESMQKIEDHYSRELVLRRMQFGLSQLH